MPGSLRSACSGLAGLWLVTACAKAPPSPAPAPVGQVILTMQEHDQDHGEHALDGRSGIVDINSTLYVLIDSTALRQRVSALVGTSAISPAVITRLAALQAMAVQRLGLVQQYTDALGRYSASKTPENLKAVEGAVALLAQPAISLLEAADEDPGVGARLDAQLDALFETAETISVARQYDVLLAFAGEEAASARRVLDAEALQAGVRIQVGTWLSTSQGVRPAHTTGLDQTEPSSPYVVDRWSVLLDDAQRKQMQTLQQAAKAANTNGAAGLIAMLTASARETLSLVSKQLRDCATTLRTAAERATSNAGDQPSAQARGIIGAIEDHLKTLEASAAEVAMLAGKYRAPSSSTDAVAFLEATNVDLASLRTIVTTVQGAVKELEGNLARAPEALLRGGDLASGGAGLKSKLGACLSTIGSALKGWAAGQGGVNHAEQIRGLAEDAWNDVLSFDVASVPSRSTLQLVTTGPRRPGDLVLVRVAATRGTPAKREILDEQQVTLQRVLPHLELSVGLVFADPLSASEVQRRFQAAPAYSVLYRRGSRRSMARNSFWNLGVGLNVAAVDFDKDDVPELGLGLTASTLSDLLQVGVGYNVFLDDAYWFFGVRLPVGTIGLGGSRTPLEPEASGTNQ